jgi:hypothetical protein
MKLLRIDGSEVECNRPGDPAEDQLDWMVTEWMREYRFGDIAELVPLRLALPIGDEFLKLLRLSVLELDEKTQALLKAHSDRAFRQQLEGVMRDEIETKQALPPRFWPALVRQELQLLREWRALEEEIK